MVPRVHHLQYVVKVMRYKYVIQKIESKDLIVFIVLTFIDYKLLPEVLLRNRFQSLGE